MFSNIIFSPNPSASAKIIITIIATGKVLNIPNAIIDATMQVIYNNVDFEAPIEFIAILVLVLDVYAFSIQFSIINPDIND